MRLPAAYRFGGTEIFIRRDSATGDILDTDTVSDLIRQHAAVVRHVVATPIGSLCISATTEAELLFGPAKRPQAGDE